MIAFFGMGLLGGNFVRRLRERGEDVRVWNRSPERAKALEETGAVAVADPAEAVKGATRLHLTLSDDAAVDAVLERARPGFGDGLVVVDHSTTSPAGAAERVKRWADRGVELHHAPVFMGPSNARNATGFMLTAGPRAPLDRLEPELAKMTGRVVYCGEEPDRAAKIKLLGNLFFMFVAAGITDLLTLGKAMGVPPAEAAQLFEWLNPQASTGFRAKKILAGDFAQPSWELAMARKDARLMLESAEAGGAPLDVLPAIAALMDRFIARGHGHDDWMVIGKDAVTPKP